MDTEALVNVRPISPQEIDLGDLAAVALREESKLNVRAALWWYDVEAATWKFVVATPAYTVRGPRDVYHLIRKTLDNRSLLDRLQLDRVWAVEDDHAIITALRDFVGEGLHIYFENCTILGKHVAGAHVYFIDKKRARTKKRRKGTS